MSNFYAISGYQGSTLVLSLNLTNPDGTYLNLSGNGVRGFAKYRFDSTTYLLDLHPSITSEISGQILISGNSNELAAVPIGVYNYNIEVYNSGDYVFKPLVGHLSVFPEVANL